MQQWGGEQSCGHLIGIRQRLKTFIQHQGICVGRCQATKGAVRGVSYS